MADPLEVCEDWRQMGIAVRPAFGAYSGGGKHRLVVITQVKSALVAALQNDKIKELAKSIDSLLSIDEVRYDAERETFHWKGTGSHTR